MTKLKPCPFCGCDDVVEDYMEEIIGRRLPVICCEGCGIKVLVTDDSPYVEIEKIYTYCRQKVIEGWNRRVEE